VADIVRTARHVAYVVQQTGREPWRHLAFGSDFDGAVEVPFDVSGLPILTAALAPSMTEADLRDMAGRNICRLLLARLPGGDAAMAERSCGTVATPVRAAAR
jgi:microsomal dipeptidase-like Zn-dependent dipeptidase